MEHQENKEDKTGKSPAAENNEGRTPPENMTEDTDRNSVQNELTTRHQIETSQNTTNKSLESGEGGTDDGEGIMVSPKEAVVGDTPTKRSPRRPKAKPKESSTTTVGDENRSVPPVEETREEIDSDPNGVKEKKRSQVQTKESSRTSVDDEEESSPPGEETREGSVSDLDGDGGKTKSHFESSIVVSKESRNISAEIDNDFELPQRRRKDETESAKTSQGKSSSTLHTKSAKNAGRGSKRPADEESSSQVPQCQCNDGPELPRKRKRTYKKEAVGSAKKKPQDNSRGKKTIKATIKKLEKARKKAGNGKFKVIQNKKGTKKQRINKTKKNAADAKKGKRAAKKAGKKAVKTMSEMIKPKPRKGQKEPEPPVEINKLRIGGPRTPGSIEVFPMIL